MTPPPRSCPEKACRKTSYPKHQDGRGRWIYRCADGHTWTDEPEPTQKAA